MTAAQLQNLRGSLLALFKRYAFNKRPQDALADALLQSYQEPQRHYHTLEHIDECLRLHAMLLPYCQAPDEVALAIWYHDVVYDPKAKDNEAKSAERARAELAALRGNDPSIERISQMIIATQHHKAATPDEQILMDIDLSILAAQPARFAAYCQQIRAEYAHVPYWQYVVGRWKVLRHFSSVSPIFKTAALAHQNPIAQDNLARATRFPNFLLT
jgi:predicted metal-dependent HD superfamily phosphohydrolase